MEESSKENQVESPEPPPTPSLKVRLKYILGQTWKFFFALVVPILYMPIFLWKPKPEYEKCPHAAYLTFLMATYWVSECIPLAVTSFLPIVLVPLFGIANSDEICAVYFNNVIVFLFGGCVVALSFEYSDLHSRISFFVMKSVGAQASTLLFGMMMTCMTLSCWMNNTSTTAMMVPVVFSIMEQYKMKLIPTETAQELAEKYGGPDNLDLPSENNSQISMPSKNDPEAGGGPSLGGTPRKSQVDDISNQPKKNEGGTPDKSLAPSGQGTEKDEFDVLMKPKDNEKQEESTVSKGGFVSDVEYWQHSIDSKKKYVRNLEVMFLIGIAVASNIGGTGVITGTGTNLIATSQLRGYKDRLLQLNEIDRPKNVKDWEDCVKTNANKYWDVDFSRWVQLNVFGMLLNVIVGWAFLTAFYQGPPACISHFWRTTILRKKPDVLELKRKKELRQASDQIKVAIKHKYEELGKTSFHQWLIVALFTFLVFLWILRNPMFARGVPVNYTRPNGVDNETLELVHPSCAKGGHSKLHSTWGWARFFGDECNESFLHDYVSTILVCFLLFVLPKESKYYKNILRGGIGEGIDDPLLPFEYMCQNFPFGPIFMLGGGFGISKAISESKLSNLISEVLEDSDTLKNMGLDLVLASSLIFVAVVTTIASNTATAVIVCPILIELARTKGVPPLYLVLPPVVGASYAFCLPISTPPNAIVYDKANMKQLDMLRPGIFLTFICNTLLYFTTITWTYWALEVSSYPGSCDTPQGSGTERSLTHYTKQQRALFLDDDELMF